MSISLGPSDIVARAQDIEVTVVQKRSASKGETKCVREMLRPFHEGLREPAGFRIACGSAA